MRTAVAPRPVEATIIRPATGADLEALVALEQHAFATDRISRRGFRRFVGSDSAAVLVAEIDGCLAGYALVLFRAGNAIARLYSIAVAPTFAGRGVGATLLAAAEAAAIGARREPAAARGAGDERPGDRPLPQGGLPTVWPAFATTTRTARRRSGSRSVSRRRLRRFARHRPISTKPASSHAARRA